MFGKINLTVVAKLFLLAVATPTDRLLLACALCLAVLDGLISAEASKLNFSESGESTSSEVRQQMAFPTITCSITQDLDMLSLPSCHTSMANLASDSRRDCGR